MLKNYLTMLGLVFLLFISLLGCTEKTDQQPVEGAKGVFYEVKNGDSNVYLLGSVHVGNSDMYPLHGTIKEAYSNSDYLAVEVDINNLNPMEMMQFISEKGVYQDGSTLKDHIESDLYDELITLLLKNGMPEEEIAMFKPWLIADMVESILIEQYGYSFDLGIDQYFLTKAAEDNKEIISLETLEDQLSLFTILSAESQEESLRSTLFEQEENKEMLENLVIQWIKGDIDSLSELREIDDDEPADLLDFHYALTDERDKEMAEKIDQFLRSEKGETYFVVVGALHLVGENSIVDLLRSKGYEVNEVFGD